MLGDPELLSRPGRDRAPRLKWATYTSIRFIRRGKRTRRTGDIYACTVPVRRTRGSDANRDDPEGTPRCGLRGADIRCTWRSPSDTARMVAPLLLLAPPAYAPVVALLAFMYVEVSPWTSALFLVPALAAQRLYGLYQGERKLAADLSTANATLARANLQFAAAFIATLDARDRYTAGHSAAVAIYSRDIAGRMGLPTETQEHAYLCGLVHDIGKIGLPPGLARETRSTNSRGAAPDAGALGNWRADSRARRRVLGNLNRCAFPSRANRWSGLPRWSRRKGDSTRLPHHRCR